MLYSGEQYCCYGLGCLGSYNPQYVAVPTITGNNLVAPTNGGGGGDASSPAPSGGSGASSTYAPTTEPPSAATATVYKNYYFTITWSYDSYYYTGTAEWEYTWQVKYDSTTVSFYCSDYEDASSSAEMYSMTENFPTPSFTNTMATATATATGFGAGSGGTGSSSGAMAGTSNCVGMYLGLIIVTCLLVNLVL